MRRNYDYSVYRTPEFDKKIDEAIDFAEQTLIALRLMKEGFTENYAAKTLGMEGKHLRKWILNITHNDSKCKLGLEGLKDDEFIFYTPGEKLWVDLTGEKNSEAYYKIPYDIEQTWNYIFPRVLKKREIQVIRQYYWENANLDKVAKTHDITRERVRQLIHNGQRKLVDANRKAYKDYLYLGLGVKAMADAKRKRAQIIEREAELNKELIDIIPPDEHPKKLAMIEACKKIDENFDLENAMKIYKPPVTMSYILNNEEMSVRTYNCIKRGFGWEKKKKFDRVEGRWVEDPNGLNLNSLIFRFRPDDFMKCRNLGRKSYDELVGILSKYGWTEYEED